MSHRYMVNVDDDISAFLQKSSKKKHKSISSLILELINEALELREDYYLSQLAEEAEKRSEGKPLISAEEVWRKCDLK
jgi:predicted DNA-binding protein